MEVALLVFAMLAGYGVFVLCTGIAIYLVSKSDNNSNPED